MNRISSLRLWTHKFDCTKNCRLTIIATVLSNRVTNMELTSDTSVCKCNLIADYCAPPLSALPTLNCSSIHLVVSCFIQNGEILHNKILENTFTSWIPNVKRKRKNTGFSVYYKQPEMKNEYLNCVAYDGHLQQTVLKLI